MNSLQVLNCVGNQLSSLDLSSNRALQALVCNGNQLSSLDLSVNTELTYLDISANPTPFTLYVWALPFIIDDFFDTSPASTKILGPNDISDRPAMAYSLSLFQNFPNPFNPSTTIEFTLPRSELVQLKVYNQHGKEVSTLVSNKLNQGSHIYTFDGNNLASGVYYYHLTAGDYRDVKKMILLK